MNYEAKSNSELNERLRELLKAKHDDEFIKWAEGRQIRGDIAMILNPSKTIYTHTLNYCRDWSKTGPIIHQLCICVDGRGHAHKVVDDDYAYITNCPGDPLRAAVIVAIKILEGVA